MIPETNQNEGHEKEDDLVEDLRVAVKNVKLPHFDGLILLGGFLRLKHFLRFKKLSLKQN